MRRAFRAFNSNNVMLLSGTIEMFVATLRGESEDRYIKTNYSSCQKGDGVEYSAIVEYWED